MKKTFGYVIGCIGAILWESGGWTGDEQYEDLNWVGKIGYRMLCKGLDLMGVTYEMLVELSEKL